MPTEFFDAFNAADAEAIAATFTADATVTDDGKTFHGTEQIHEWARTHVVGFKATITGTDGNVVTASVAGDFPGSPLSFDFAFQIDDSGLIRRLDTTPSE